jgi:peptidoglycan hydrolase CwlO-like protein
MFKFKNMRYICDKHDRILELSDCSGEETREELLDRMSDIYSVTVDAKTDGEKMEKGLNEKKKKIDELDQEIENLNSELMNLKNGI